MGFTMEKSQHPGFTDNLALDSIINNQTSKKALYVLFLRIFTAKATPLKLGLLSCQLLVTLTHKRLVIPDPTSARLVSKLIAGAYGMRPTFDIRLPITVTILNRLVESLVHTTKNMYYQYLYKTMFLFAFYTFARIGELTSSVNSAVQLYTTKALFSSICYSQKLKA